ncbi:MAG: CehA/McbA family metallohydrolase [bacterium]
MIAHNFRPRILPLLLGLFFLQAATVFSQRFDVPKTTGSYWFKGNTHTHTTKSDGDSPPEVVTQWYKSHGYNFLVLSDHNTLTDTSSLPSFIDSTFILIRGEELTTSAKKKPVHVNALNIQQRIDPRKDSILVRSLQLNVDAVREAGGLPHINHPNFCWAFDQKELANVRGYSLLEIFNGHPEVHNLGGGNSPSVEAMWDQLLSRGMKIYGLATDDAHNFSGEFSRTRANPGRGWIVVRADNLEANELMQKLEAGQFYASTGVELNQVRIAPKQMEVQIRQKKDFKYTTEFIGTNGRVLATVKTNPAAYTLRGSEKYVRARVVDSGGARAWVQPVFVIAQ